MFDYSMKDKTWILPCQVGFTGRKFENSKRNAFTLFFGQALHHFNLLRHALVWESIPRISLPTLPASICLPINRFILCCCMNFSISWRDLYFFINSSGGFSSNFLVSLCFDVRILLLFLSLDISWCLLTWHWLDCLLFFDKDLWIQWIFHTMY